MASRQTNAAYNFELFEVKPVEKQPALNVVKNQKYKKRDRVAVLKILSSVAVVVTVVCILLYGRARLTELTAQIGDYTDRYAESLSEYTRLSAEVEGKISLRSVEEGAKALGMAKVQPYQVEYVNMEEEDSFDISEEAQEEAQEENTLSQKVSLYIESFLEYIKFW